MLSFKNIYKDDDNLVIIVKKDKIRDFDFLDDRENGHLRDKVENKEFSIDINHYTRRVFIRVVDENPSEKNYLEKFRLIGSKLTGTLNEYKISSVFIANPDVGSREVLALAEGMILSNYQFLKYRKNAGDKKNSLSEIYISPESIKEEELKEINILCQAVSKARDLVNEPLSHLSAVKLSEEAEKLGKEAGFSVEVLNKPRIEALGMGGLLAVNRGSIDPPTFSIMEWKPENAVNDKPVVIVGKGVVYDTGGISLKPSSSMDTMKSDMSGAAAVISTMFVIASLKIPVHVIGLVPATDNMPDGKARVPGDIINMYDGTTVEVLNTDAEGRLILADGMAYAKKFNPGLVMTIATLTGSAANAIGKYGSVMMGTAEQKMMSEVVKAGEEVYERVAWFPFWPEYDELLKSDIADLKNIGGKEAGAITAGKFLSNFTDTPFIHIDIAGTAYLSSNDGYRLKGGTGTGVRLLFQFLKGMNL